MAASGSSNPDIAGELGIKQDTVGRWNSRFAEHRPEGIEKVLP